MLLNSRQRIFTLETVPNRRVAIVFGAGLRRDGTPTAVLKDRVETAARLYFAGKVNKILMSGATDADRFNYHEPRSMFHYAVQLGIPADKIEQDLAGRSTYDTCYRARKIFEISEAVLITQSFHLPRALYTCNAMGTNAVGVPAEGRIYRPLSLLFWNLREMPASAKALWDIYFSKPIPILGAPQPLFPQDAQ